MNAHPIRIALLSLALAAASAALPAHAARVSCYGCYDGKDGKEHCTTVQVEGSCNVFTFCTAIGCSTSGARASAVDKLLGPQPQPTRGSPAASAPAKR